MLQLPDFMEKQILIIHPKNGVSVSDLKFKNENVVLSKEGQIVNQVSIHKLMAIFIVGEMTLTSFLLRKARKHGISLFFLNHNFEQFAEVCSVAEGNYLLRHNQYHFKNELEFSKHIVTNKCFNQIELLHSACPEFFNEKSKKDFYNDLMTKIESADSLNTLLGLEGTMSKNYFGAYFKPMGWYKRMPRSKIDPVNLLLDIGYTMLFNLIDSLLRLHGFDTYKGIYHQLFFQRKSLSCDIMEPFRPLIDHALLKAFNLKQFDDDDFDVSKGKYALKITEGRKYVKIFLDALMDSKEDIFVYIKQFYFCILNEKNDYPFYKLK